MAFVLLIGAVYLVTGQDSYNTAIGIQGGFPSGLTFRHFFRGDSREGTAGELILGWAPGWVWYDYGLGIWGFLQKQKALGLSELPGLHVYGGPGAGLGIFYYKKAVWRGLWYELETRSAISLGAALLVGSEYVVDRKIFPITLGLNLGLGFGFRFGEDWSSPVWVGLVGGIFGRWYF